MRKINPKLFLRVIGLFIVFFRAILLYVIIIFCIRIMGKRQLGELQPGELVVTIMLSNIATLPIEDINIPVAMGLVPIFTIVCLDIFMSYISLSSRRFRRLIGGSPKIVISNGKIDQKIMRRLRFTTDDLFEALRSQQVFDIDDVQLAVVETTGQISVYLKKEKSPVTLGDITDNAENSDPPMLIVDNGNLIPGSLSLIGGTKKWLDKILKKECCRIDDIYIMTAQKDKSYTIIQKE